MTLNEGLFIPSRDADLKIEVNDGEIIYRQKAARLKPSKIIFRADTQDNDKYWLEMELPGFADPGDAYVFLIQAKAHSGFVVRSTEDGRCKWALGLNDLQLGRDLLFAIGKIYDLPPLQIEDRTKNR